MDVPVEHNKFSMTVVIENFAKLREQISEVEEHFGMKWYAISKRDKDNWTMTLFAIILPERSRKYGTDFSWTACFLEPENRVFHESDPVKSDSNGGSDTTTPLNFTHTLHNQMIGNRVTVELDIEVFQLVAFPKFDFSKENPELYTDVVLIVEEREFHVNKVLLSSFSTYFATMFHQKFRESSATGIPLENVNADDFQELLEVIYHKSDVTVENARELLELVNYFDVKDVKNKCENVIIGVSKDEISVKEKLHLADRYLLQELMKHCLDSVKSVSELQDIVPENVKDLNPASIPQILQKFIDLR